MNGNTKLSDHQKRVLAALRALENTYEWRWWSRNAIGYVIGAGGYHTTTQVKTMSALKKAGMIQTERSSWPAEVSALIRCNCACCCWGLTDAGREIANTIKVRWSEESLKGINFGQWDHSQRFPDEDEFPQYNRETS